jgi:hypothetical protein
MVVSVRFRPDNDQLEVIIRGMKSLLDKVDFTHIRPDWDNSSSDEEQK